MAVSSRGRIFAGVFGVLLLGASGLLGTLAGQAYVKEGPYDRAFVCAAGAARSPDCERVSVATVTRAVDVGGRNPAHLLDVTEGGHSRRIDLGLSSTLLENAVPGELVGLVRWHGAVVAVKADGGRLGAPTTAAPTVDFAQDLGATLECATAAMWCLMCLRIPTADPWSPRRSGAATSGILGGLVVLITGYVLLNLTTAVSSVLTGCGIALALVGLCATWVMSRAAAARSAARGTARATPAGRPPRRRP